MNILVLGGGGREHAIAWALAKSPRTDSLYVAPGNGGTDGIAQNVPDLNPEDGQAVLAFVRENAIDFVVIGPEAPLVAGVADVLRAAGVPTFGPDAQGAQLEGSKTFSKKFMDANDIPTARYASFTDLEPALAYVRELGAPIVVKADGLAAGKGVVVADELEDAEDAVRSCFDGAFGDSGKTVLIEECLTGPECSMLAFVSDGKAHCMATAQDHKRAFDGDRGPNTGGMGAYSPVPIVTPDELAAMHDIMERAAVATAREFDNDYRGVLYGGFMLTPEGPKIIEFNARFGDPETQVVLPLLESDLLKVMIACTEGMLADTEVRFSDGAAACVILASGGYPVAYEKGKPITGLVDGQLPDEPDVTVYHSGTAITEDGQLVTNGGRVLGVTATAPGLPRAISIAYEAAEHIHFDKLHKRTDIGMRALKALAEKE